MKTRYKIAALTALAALAYAGSASANTIIFQSAGTINFGPSGNITFSAVKGVDFTVAANTGGLGTESATGVITGTGYKITGPVVNGQTTAPVTGSDTLTITDSDGGILTGTLVFADIEQSGSSGNLPWTVSANLSGAVFTGSGSDPLSAFKGTDIDVLDWRFASPKGGYSLKQLFNGAGGGKSIKDSYSGQISSVPDGGLTLATLGSAFLALSAVRGRFSKKS